MENYLSEIHNKIVLRVHNWHNYPPHFHQELELIFMLEGSNTACCNGIEYTIPAGSVFLAAPNAIHSYDNPPHQCRSILLIINPKLLTGAASQLTYNISSAPIWSDPEKKSPVWSMIRYAYEHGRSMSAECFTLFISSIISLILEDLTLSTSSHTGRTEQRILEYCQNHYSDPITSESVAEALGLSRSHVSHTFSNIFKTSFPTYINGLRLNDAIKFLSETRMSIIEIASASGFNSLRSFNRVFTDHFGFSPSQCRKQHREGELMIPNFGDNIPLDS